MIKRLRSWIDDNILVIGVILLCIGLVGVALGAVRDLVPFMLNASGAGGEPSPIGVALHLLYAIASPLAYNSVLLIVAGLVLRAGRAELVGFEHTAKNELVVDGPDDEHVVWLGKRFANTFDAEVAAQALARRMTTLEKERPKD